MTASARRATAEDSLSVIATILAPALSASSTARSVELAYGDRLTARSASSVDLVHQIDAAATRAFEQTYLIGIIALRVVEQECDGKRRSLG